MNKHPKLLTLILAGGKGSRLDVLTEQRAKPVLTFGGFYRLIDFALSNCMHSGCNDVWVVEQYQLHSLNEHLSNGRPWDLDRTYGGLQVLPPYEDREESEAEGGFAAGNADAIYRHRSFIRSFNPDLLLVLSADHIYKLDFRDVIEHHLAKNAEVTMVTTKVPPGETASRFAVVKTDESGRVIEFDYKPEQPNSDLITTEVFVYNAPKLLDALDALTEEDDTEGEEKATALKDYGHRLLPKLVEEGAAFEYRFNGYWRDVGTIDSYWKAHMDLLADGAALNLDDPDWSILTLASQRVPARVYGTATIDNCLISPGCTIRGRVSRSVLAPGVTIEENAEVSDSIVLHNTVIKREARIRCAIIDADVTIGEAVRIGIMDNDANQMEDDRQKSDIAVVGQNVTLAAGTVVPPRARLSS